MQEKLETVPFGQFFRNRLIGWIGHALLLLQPSISLDRKNNLAKIIFLINYELKTPSVEMACLLGIQNEIQAAWFKYFLGP